MRRTTESMRMLAVLVDSEGTTARQVADATGINIETVSNRISWYVQNEHVERLNPGHKPQRYVVTGLGRELLDLNDDEDWDPPPKPVDIADVLAMQPPLVRAWSVAREQEATA